MAYYSDPVLAKLETVIDVADGGFFVSYWQGDPLLIAKSDLPALIMTKEGTEIGDASNAEDYHRQNIVLTAVVDIRKYLGDTPTDIHVAAQKLYDVIEGRNASDFTLKTTSLIDILRTNHNLGNNANIDLQTPMRVEYGFTRGKRGEGTWSWEAWVTVPVYFVQLR